MLELQGSSHNIEYMILGYSLAGLILLMTAVYLAVKARRLRGQAELLIQLERDEEAQENRFNRIHVG